MNAMHIEPERNYPITGRTSVRTMYGYLRPHRLPLLAGGLLSLATAATGLVLPLVARALIDNLSKHRGLAGLVVVMCLLMLANVALGAAGNYILLRIGDTIILGTRKRMVGRLLRLTVETLDGSEPGDLIARATVDTTLLRDAVCDGVVPGIVGPLTMLTALILMGLVDAVLLGVMLFTIGCIAVTECVVMPRIARATRKTQQSVGAMTAALERVFGGFRTMKAYGAESSEGARVNEAAVNAWRASLRADLWQALVGNTAVLAIQFSFLAVMAVGGAQVASNAISVGTLIAFLLYVLFLSGPISQLTNAITQYQIGAAAVTRIEEAERLPNEPVAWPAVIHPGKDGPASVEFENVRFSYRADLAEVHHGISFVIPPQGITAFVGPSGAGKTTLFSLIERFYEPRSGRVLIDGTDTRDWPLGPLRAAIGYVEQDAPVISGTLRENLLLGAPDASADDLTDVLRITRLSDLAKRLPDGLETNVGHRGTRLSGGERQRVAIARALLRKPRLLLLDEATSQLDAINEAALRETVAVAAETITVLVVAHRLSTVTMADRIIVMDSGRVQAVGKHAQLLAVSPLYAELATTQLLATQHITE